MITKLKIALYVFFSGLKCLIHATVKVYKKAPVENSIQNIQISLQVAHKDEKYEARNLSTRIQTNKDHKDIRYK